MGCSHSVRRPENVKGGKSKLTGEVKKYQTFDYSEVPAGGQPPSLNPMEEAIPDISLHKS